MPGGPSAPGHAIGQTKTPLGHYATTPDVGILNEPLIHGAISYGESTATLALKYNDYAKVF